MKHSAVKTGTAEFRSGKSITTVGKLCEILNAELRNAADVPITSFAFGKQKIKPGCAYFAADKETAVTAFERVRLLLSQLSR